MCMANTLSMLKEVNVQLGAKRPSNLVDNLLDCLCIKEHLDFETQLLKESRKQNYRIPTTDT